MESLQSSNWRFARFALSLNGFGTPKRGVLCCEMKLATSNDGGNMKHV